MADDDELTPEEQAEIDELDAMADAADEYAEYGDPDKRNGGGA